VTEAATPLYVTIGLPIATFVAGFITSRFTLSRKDKKDLEQDNYENSVKLAELNDNAYTNYTAAIKAYVGKKAVTLDDFVLIATTGDKYFSQAAMLASAILSDKVDIAVRDNTLLAKVRDVAERTLPKHYETLQGIARTKGWPYVGELRRQDHEAIFAVVEKFGNAPAWVAAKGPS
jgi:hypothetical protein